MMKRCNDATGNEVRISKGGFSVPILICPVFLCRGPVSFSNLPYICKQHCCFVAEHFSSLHLAPLGVEEQVLMVPRQEPCEQHILKIPLKRAGTSVRLERTESFL